MTWCCNFLAIEAFTWANVGFKTSWCCFLATFVLSVVNFVDTCLCQASLRPSPPLPNSTLLFVAFCVLDIVCRIHQLLLNTILILPQSIVWQDCWLRPCRFCPFGRSPWVSRQRFCFWLTFCICFPFQFTLKLLIKPDNWEPSLKPVCQEWLCNWVYLSHFNLYSLVSLSILGELKEWASHSLFLFFYSSNKFFLIFFCWRTILCSHWHILTIQ